MTTASQDPSHATGGSPALDFDPDALREKYRTERDKRIRKDGTDQYVETKGDHAHFVDDPYVEPGFTRAPLTDEIDVALIGAGFADCSPGRVCVRRGSIASV